MMFLHAPEGESKQAVLRSLRAHFWAMVVGAIIYALGWSVWSIVVGS